MGSNLKNKGRHTLKKHYFLLVVVCLFAAFLGSEFSSSISLTKMQNNIEIKESNLISALKNDNIEEIKKQEEQKIEKIKKENHNNILGRSNGVLSGFINSFTTGSFLITIIQAIQVLGANIQFLAILLVILSLFIIFLLWFFLTNTYVVISRRIFLESRTYEKISKSRFLFLSKVNKWFKAAFSMFILYIYKFLWNLTIIGGIIKRYSYYLVPYIIAENPDIKASTAIKLSRDMMYNHKWECFKLELSFIGWHILGILTFGLTNIFYTNPYKVATFSEYFTYLRNIALKNKIPNINLLNDKYLYEKASINLLQKEYKDIIKSNNEIIKDKMNLTGIKGFLIKNFGISILNKKEKEIYDKQEVAEYKKHHYQNIIAAEAYPIRLSPLKEEQDQRVEHTNYLKSYTIVNIIMMFFIFSFIGWIWEVSLHLIKDGVFVNRGALHGPWLPIYGYGGILILIFLNRFRKNVALEFGTTLVLCGLVEYFTSYFLEINHGLKWWDYSGYFLNLNGRICAEGLLVFGLGGLAIVYLLAPVLDNLLNKLNHKFLLSIVSILLIIFITDQVYSNKHPNTGKGITSYSVSSTWINKLTI